MAVFHNAVLSLLLVGILKYGYGDTAVNNFSKHADISETMHVLHSL